MKIEIDKAIVTMASLYEAIERAGGASSIVLSRERLAKTTAPEFVANLAVKNMTFIHNQEGATQ